MTRESLAVSLILSVHNEELNLQPLVERLVSVMERYVHAPTWEAVLVDDASSDGSWVVMQELRDRFPQYVVLAQHDQRRGQKGCFMTGFELARGTYSVLMDADLQVLPEELPLVLDKALVEGYEIVCTYNDPERGGKNRGFVSAIGNVFMKLLFRSPVRDAGANFMAIQTRYVRGVDLLANDQRYLLPISMRRGLKRITEVGVIFGLRGYGRSKYNKLRKALMGIPEMFQLKQRLLSGTYDQPTVPDSLAPIGRRPYLIDVAHLSLTQAVDDPELLAALDIARRDDTRSWTLYDRGKIGSLASWQTLDWDSEMLERSCGRLVGLWAEGDYYQRRDMLTSTIAACLRDASAKGVRFMSLRLPVENQSAAHAAESVGFNVIEAYLNYSNDMSHIPEPDPRVRPAAEQDVEAAGEIAYRAFRHNRFISDAQLPEHQSRHSRREWVRNGFNGRSDAAYVAEHAGQVAGFLLLKSRQEPDGTRTGIIDLIAVDPDMGGHGLGSALVKQALWHYRDSAQRVEVGTQAKNSPAVNIYARQGFQLGEAFFSLHWHSDSVRRL